MNEHQAMTKRDWQKDWKLAQRIRLAGINYLPDDPHRLNTTQAIDYVCAAYSLHDWLLRVQELENALQLAYCGNQT